MIMRKMEHIWIFDKNFNYELIRVSWITCIILPGSNIVRCIFIYNNHREKWLVGIFMIQTLFYRRRD